MLCCVSKTALDRGPPYDQPSFRVESAETSEPVLCLEKDVPPVLLPCAICARTFMPQSLEKHTRICERAAVKKRKPFDSAKQRIQGTDLAEFLPKQEKRRTYSEERAYGKSKSSWKETHDDFLRAIRAARNEIVGSATQRQCSSVVSTGAPTRANEQGICPTCNRHFGIKAYDRHVAWCKERATRVPVSPATNIAKERLEARMKYRAPVLKSRRAVNREKYSPGSATTLQNKTSPTQINKPKESASVPSCNKTNASPIKKPTVVRRPSQTKEYPILSGPMKSRPADRLNRPMEGDPESIPSRLTHPAKRTATHHFPVPPLKSKKDHHEECETVQRQHSRETGEKLKRNERINDHLARMQRASIVSARSQGNPKVNDVAVNVGIVEMIVQPCTIHKEDELVTWKQISREKLYGTRSSHSYCSLDLDDQSSASLPLSKNTTEISDSLRNYSDKNKLEESGSANEDLVFVQKLNQTYSIQDTIDDFNELEVSDNVQIPIKHSPRIEFYLKTAGLDCSKDEQDFTNNFKSNSTDDETFPKVATSQTKSKTNFTNSDNTIQVFETAEAQLTENKVNISKPNEGHMLQTLHNEYEDTITEGTCPVVLHLEDNMYEMIHPSRASTPIGATSRNQNCDVSSARGKSDISDNDYHALTVGSTRVEHKDAAVEVEQNMVNDSQEIGCQVNICDCSLKNFKGSKSAESWRRRCGMHIISNLKTNVQQCTSDDTLIKNRSLKKENLSTSKEIDRFNSDKTFIVEKWKDNTEDVLENYVNQNLSCESETSPKNSFKVSNSRENGMHPETIEQRTSTDKDAQLRRSAGNVRLSVSKSGKLSTEEMETKIRRSMSLMRDCTDTLVSASVAVNNKADKQPDFIEVETIEAIDVKNRTKNLKTLRTIRSRDASILEEIRDRHDKIQNFTRASKNQLITLDPPNLGDNKLSRKNPNIRILPPVPHNRLIRRSGSCKDYDPFLLAEQQMNDLLSDTSESVMDSPSVSKNQTSFPLSHSSAFVKYPSSSPDKRSSLIAPPTEFDDFVSDFSSDSTETNSMSREVFLRDFKGGKDLMNSTAKSIEKNSVAKPLGRRVIIDKSKALGGEAIEDQTDRENKNVINNTERNRKIVGKGSPKGPRTTANRSHSIRASSAPKLTPDRKTSYSSNNNNVLKKSYAKNEDQSSTTNLNNRANNYTSLSGSNLSLSSIVSSEVDIKRSNSVFDELMASFEDENGPFPSSLRSLLRNDSLSTSSPVHDTRHRNGQISDEELSSPEGYKRQDHSKLSADSAYSSLNRKYSNHGRSANDVVGRFDEDPLRNSRKDYDGVSVTKYKLSKFCHECGFQFPETAKFCCQCGIKRLAL